jgi:Pyruvate/2-oxoacid:ferredoxin oxidoreductase gamma subunit
MDICRVASAAGSPWVDRAMATDRKLSTQIRDAVQYQGFALVDIWGVCPGRYGKKNRVTLKGLEKEMAEFSNAPGRVRENEREEFSAHYRRRGNELPPSTGPVEIETFFSSSLEGRKDILLLGAAGQRINTAGELLCMAAMTAGLHVSQKNDYPITVLRGHSVSEVVLSPVPVKYTGIGCPDVVLALSVEGVTRRKKIFETLGSDSLVVRAKSVEIPEHRGQTFVIDFREMRIPAVHWALISLAALTKKTGYISEKMLKTGLACRFAGKALDEAESLIEYFFKHI